MLLNGLKEEVQTHDPPGTRGEEFNNSTTDAVYRLFNVLYF
jgi:hypothetical protein